MTVWEPPSSLWGPDKVKNETEWRAKITWSPLLLVVQSGRNQQYTSSSFPASSPASGGAGVFN